MTGPTSAVTCFTVAAGNDDLGTGAESEGNGENTNIEKPTHGRSTEGYLTDTSQKGSVGDVDDILRKQAQENRVTDTPDLFVGIHKEGFKFAGCKDTTFCRSRRADRGRSQFLPDGNVKRMAGFPSGFVCTL